MEETSSKTKHQLLVAEIGLYLPLMWFQCQWTVLMNVDVLSCKSLATTAMACLSAAATHCETGDNMGALCGELLLFS